VHEIDVVDMDEDAEKTSIFNDSDLYTEYEVRIRFREKCYAGMPKSEDILKKWIEAKGEMPLEKLDEKKEVLDLVEEEELVSCGFRLNDNGIFLRDFQIEALLKQCGTTLGIFVASRGSKGMVQHGLTVRPRELYFVDKVKPDGVEVIAGHVMTPQGKRSILKQVEYVLHASLVFRLQLLGKVWAKSTGASGRDKLEQKKLGEAHLLDMLHLGQNNGIGSCRSLGGGKFNCIGFEKIA